MYTDVRNTEVKHSILLEKWVFDRTLQYLFTYIPLANKDMFNHKNMTRYHVYYFSYSIVHCIKLSQTISNIVQI